MAKINVAGIDKAKLLAALYNEAKPLGMGMLHYDPTPMTREAALEIISRGDDKSQMFPGFRGDNHLHFDYVKGRPLKVDLSGDELDTWGYDHDQGEARG